MQEEGHVKASKTLQDQPVLFIDCQWLWNAFSWLSQRRPYGANGPQPLSVHDLQAYAALKGIRRDDDVDQMLHIIGLMDDEWLADWYAREKARQDKTTSPPRGKRH